MNQVSRRHGVECIQQTAEQLAISVSEQQCEQVYDYLCLLEKWNKTYNLTAIRDVESMLSLHIADSLSIGPYLQGSTVLDIGTGAGLPGLPLAICYPHLHFTLLDSVGKKVRFLRHVVATLGLKNVTAEHQRVESYSAAQPFDVIMARAVATLKKIHQLGAPHCHRNGCFLLQKGEYPTQELAELTCPHEVITLSVPGLPANRHLVRMQKGESHD